MLSRIFRATSTPIGCTCRDAMRLVQLHVRRSGAPVLRSAFIAMASDTEESTDRAADARDEQLQHTIAQARFSGRAVVSCLSNERLHCRCLRLAPMPDSELMSAVRWQIARDLDKPIDSLCTGYCDVGIVREAGKPRREVIAFAAQSKDVEAYAHRLSANGLELIAVDTEACAVARCFADRDHGDRHRADATCLIISLGERESNLIAVRLGIPRFVRRVPVGRLHIEARADSLGNGHSHQPDEPPVSLDDQRAEAFATHPSREPANSGGRSDAMQRACLILAKELAHEVTLCTHYLRDACGGSAFVGAVIGMDAQQRGFVEALTRASGIEFRPLGELLSPTICGWLGELAGSDAWSPWLAPLGLALYGREDLMGGVAA